MCPSTNVAIQISPFQVSSAEPASSLLSSPRQSSRSKPQAAQAPSAVGSAPTVFRSDEDWPTPRDTSPFVEAPPTPFVFHGASHTGRVDYSKKWNERQTSLYVPPGNFMFEVVFTSPESLGTATRNRTALQPSPNRVVLRHFFILTVRSCCLFSN